MSVQAQGLLLKRVEQLGLGEAELEVEGSVAILRLKDPQHQRRILADPGLRQILVVQARAQGFSRLALEITAGSSNSLAA